MHTFLCDVRGDNHIDPRSGQRTVLATVRLVDSHRATLDTGTSAGHGYDHTALGELALNRRKEQQLICVFSLSLSLSTGSAICAWINRANFVSDTPHYQLPGADLRHSHGHQVAP